MTVFQVGKTDILGLCWKLAQSMRFRSIEERGTTSKGMWERHVYRIGTLILVGAVLCAPEVYKEARAAETGTSSALGSIPVEYRRARMAMHFRRHDKALQEFQRCVSLAPDGVSRCEMRVWKAHCLFVLGQHKQGMVELELAIRDDPANGIAHLMLGDMYVRATEWQKATATYLKLGATSPETYPEAFMHAGYSAMRDGNYDTARQAYELFIADAGVDVHEEDLEEARRSVAVLSALKQAKTDNERFSENVRIADALIRAGDDQSAAAYIAKIASYDTRILYHRFDYRWCFDRIGMSGMFIDMARMGLIQHPDDSALRHCLILAYMRKRRFTEAADLICEGAMRNSAFIVHDWRYPLVLARASRTSDYSSHARTCFTDNLGNTEVGKKVIGGFASIGLAKEALDLVTESVRRNKRLAIQLHAFSPWYLNAGRAEDFISLVVPTCLANPGDRRLLTSLADAAVVHVGDEGALNALQVAVETNPQIVTMSKSFLRAFEMAGKGEVYLELLHSSLAKEPGDRYVRRALVTAYAQLGQSESAVVCFEEGLKEDPKGIAVPDSVWALYRNTGKDDDLVKKLRLLLDSHPDNASLRRAVVEGYIGMGDLSAACEALIQVVGTDPGLLTYSSRYLPLFKDAKMESALQNALEVRHEASVDKEVFQPLLALLVQRGEFKAGVDLIVKTAEARPEALPWSSIVPSLFAGIEEAGEYAVLAEAALKHGDVTAQERARIIAGLCDAGARKEAVQWVMKSLESDGLGDYRDLVKFYRIADDKPSLLLVAIAAVERDPTKQALRQHVIKILFSEGRFDAAIGLVASACAWKPSFLTYGGYDVADMMLAAGRGEDALELAYNVLNERCDTWTFRILERLFRASSSLEECDQMYEVAKAMQPESLYISRYHIEFQQRYNLIGAQAEMDAWDDLLGRDLSCQYMKGLSWAYLRLGDEQKSIAAWQEAMQLPDGLYFIDDAGRFFENQGELQLAEDAFRTYAMKRPRHPHPLYELGGFYFRTGDYSNSVKCFEQRLVLDSGPSTISDAHTGLARALLALGRAEEAGALCAELARTVSDDGDYAVLGRMYEVVGDLELAEESYTRYARDRSSRAMGLLGDFYQSQGRWSEARKTYREAVAPATLGEEHTAKLARVEELSCNTEKALVLYQSALKIAPTESDHLWGVVRCLVRLRRIPEAHVTVQSFLARFPRSPSARAARAWIFEQGSHLDEAIRWYEEALEACRYPPEHGSITVKHTLGASDRALKRLAVLLHNSGQHEKAEPRFDQLRAILKRKADHTPKSPWRRNDLAWFLATSPFAEDWPNAVRLAGEAVALNPSYGAAKRTLCYALWKTGRSEEATAVGEDYVALATTDPWAHYTMAATFASLGRVDDSRKSLESAIKLNPWLPIRGEVEAVLQALGGNAVSKSTGRIAPPCTGNLLAVMAILALLVALFAVRRKARGERQAAQASKEEGVQPSSIPDSSVANSPACPGPRPPLTKAVIYIVILATCGLPAIWLCRRCLRQQPESPEQSVRIAPVEGHSEILEPRTARQTGWHFICESARRDIMQRVATNAVWWRFPIEDTMSAVVHKVEGVDVAELMEAGCISALRFEQGMLLAEANTESAMATGQFDALRRAFDSMIRPGPHFQSYTWLCAYFDDNKEEARRLLDARLEERDSTPAPLLLLLKGYGDSTKAERLISEYAAGCQQIKRLHSVAKIWKLVFDEEERAAQCMTKASEGRGTSSTWCHAADTHMVVFGDEALARECVEKAEGLTHYPRDWTRCALAWKLLNDDTNAVRRCLGNAERSADSCYEWRVCAETRMLLLDDAGSAEECLMKGEGLASSAADFLQCAEMWKELFRDEALAARCLESAETVAKYSACWLRCAGAQMSISADKQRARQCMKRAESAAITASGWCECAREWKALFGDDISVGRCMQKAEDSAQRSRGWTECAREWKRFHDDDAARRCMLAAENMASHVSDWEQCATGWAEEFGDAQAVSRCLKASEQTANDSRDWRNCAEHWISLAKDTEKARVCMQKSEEAAKTMSDWCDCAARWRSLLGDDISVGRCMQKAEGSARTSYDWRKCAVRWKCLREYDAGRRCMSMAEKLANDFSDWSNCANDWAAWFGDVQAARRCLQESEKLAENSSNWSVCAAKWETLLGDENSAKRCQSRAKEFAETVVVPEVRGDATPNVIAAEASTPEESPTLGSQGVICSIIIRDFPNAEDAGLGLSEQSAADYLARKGFVPDGGWDLDKDCTRKTLESAYRNLRRKSTGRSVKEVVPEMTITELLDKAYSLMRK